MTVLPRSQASGQVEYRRILNVACESSDQPGTRFSLERDPLHLADPSTRRVFQSSLLFSSRNMIVYPY